MRTTEAEWLPLIPRNWNVLPLKFLCKFMNGTAFKPTDWSSTGIPIIRIENLNGGGEFNCFDGTIEPRYHVRSGDLLFGWSGNRGTSFGPFLWQREGLHYLNQHIFKIHGYKCDTSWLYWMLKGVTQYIEVQAHGIIGMVHITRPKLGRIPVPHPPLIEQQAIAAFLDRETARIDALIAKKTRLIDLLQEKRAALISHAVTKGLTPNAPMKDSDVEWFGSLPSHWNIKRLKYIVPGITVGIVVTPAKYYVDEGVPCLRSLNISSSRIITDDIVYISPESNELHRKSKIHAGDIVIVRTGQTGTAAVVSDTLDGANCIDLVIVRRSKRVLSDYLHYFINSRAAARQVEAKTVGSIQGHYNTSTVGDLLVPMPPLLEQDQIVTALNDQCGRLDRLASTVTDGLDRLREYRSTLISAAVTGKIDVRNNCQGDPL
ncbi:MAG: restriction endonuclease subunit S [Planctomycetes bacterium]|nr:restriction endonuclease subunit S [Planctomycetota bacterium]